MKDNGVTSSESEGDDGGPTAGVVASIDVADGELCVTVERKGAFVGLLARFACPCCGCGA